MAEINDMCTGKGNENVAFVREKLNKVISDFKKVKEVRKTLQKPKIQSVPTILACDERHHEKYYEPRWVSIGPIHHGKKKLRLAEDQYKLKLVGKFIYDRGQKSSYEDLYEKIKCELEALKQCFDEEAIKGYDDEALGWMLFFDGCFVLQFIDSYIHGELKMFFEVKKDQMALARQDLFLLENQIPFQVLKLLIDGSSRGVELMMSIKEFVRKNLMTPERHSEAAEMDWPQDDQLSPAHLLDLLRTALLRQSGKGRPEKQIKSTTTADHRPAPADPEAAVARDTYISVITRCRALGDDIASCIKQSVVKFRDTVSKLKHFNYGSHLGKGLTDPEINKASEHRDHGGGGSGGGKPGHPRFPLRGVFGFRGAKTPGPVKTKDDDNYKDYQQSFRSVHDLKAAGIILKPSKSCCLRDVKYSSVGLFAGKLELPTLIVDDSTAPKLLNLIAYEMCPDNTETEYEVTSYVSFLDSLIDYASDVKELRSARILRNLLGCDKEVAQLFNEIGKDIVPNNEIYKKVIVQIEKHYKNKCMTWVAQVLDDHFSSPWTVVAFLAAILALALTATQTWFTINPKPGPCDRYCAKNL